jgi:pimeloyl-ACP methyl ester carboxylesterase
LAGQPKTSYARNGDVNIAYQVLGDGPTDLVLVPGFISHLDLWWTFPQTTAFLRRLASFSRLILFDKRGTGLSDPVPGVPSLEDRMEDLHAVLDAAGSERTALFGISEGGPMSLLFAATYPDRATALVLYGTFAGANLDAAVADDPEAAQRYFTPDARERFGRSVAQIESVVERWGEGGTVDVFAPSFAGDPAVYRMWGFFERASASPGMVRSLIDGVYAIDVRQVLSTVRIPTLVLHRTEETAIPVESARFLADRIPGARLVELSGIDHVPWVGDTEAVVDEVEQFLTGTRHAPEADRVLSTVLFTDIVGSTERAAELGDRRWRELLDRHDDVVRRHLTTFTGREIKTTGDGFLATFDGPARAIRCACAIRDEVGDIGLAVRAGVHTGECEVRGNDVGGVAVHIGARVASKARAGEVLVSSAVKDLVVGSGIAFADRGVHELKGVPGEWRLLAVGQELEPAGADDDRIVKPGDRTTLRVARRAPGALRLVSRMTGARAGRRAAAHP